MFASRSLTKSEHRSGRRVLACVWAVEHWKTFLGEHRFTLRTDHQALVLLSQKAHGRSSMRSARWAPFNGQQVSGVVYKDSVQLGVRRPESSAITRF